MRTLMVRIGGMADAKARFVKAGADAVNGDPSAATPTLNFASYEDMHRALAPARLAIVRAFAGQEPMAIREVARRIGRDIQAVHRDVTTLLNAGVIDRSDDGIAVPYDRIHFEFDVSAAA